MALGDVGEELMALIKAKNYEKVLSKCMSMAASKQKYMIMSFSYLGLKEWKHLI